MFKLKQPLCDQMFDDGYGGGGDSAYEFSRLVKDAYQSFQDCLDTDYYMEIEIYTRIGVSNWEHDSIVAEFQKRRDTWAHNSPYPGVSFSFSKDIIYRGCSVIAKELTTTLSGRRSAVKNALIQMGEHSSQSFELKYPHQKHRHNTQQHQVINKTFDGDLKTWHFERFQKKVNAVNESIPEANIALNIKVGPDSTRVKLFSALDFPYQVVVVIDAPELLLKALNTMLELDS